MWLCLYSSISRSVKHKKITHTHTHTHTHFNESNIFPLAEIMGICQMILLQIPFNIYKALTKKTYISTWSDLFLFPDWSNQLSLVVCDSCDVESVRNLTHSALQCR